jgi:uncharacterized coiled-coil DUF342 family protein
MSNELDLVETTTENSFSKRAEMLKQKADQYNEEKTQLQEKMKTQIEEFEKKEFVLTDKSSTIKKILGFLKTDAEWAFQEAYFLNQLILEVPNKTAEDGNYYVNNRFLETLNYFISKTKGQGQSIKNSTTSFNNYLEIFDTVQSALRSTEVYKQELESIKKEIESYDFKFQSLNHGIDPDEDVELASQEIQDYQEELYKA